MEGLNDSSSSSQSYQFDTTRYDTEISPLSSFPQSQEDQPVVPENGTFLPGMEKFVLIRWKSGKSVDPRLFTLLEYFRELYEHRKEFFKKIFPRRYDEFVELYEKIGGALSKWDDDVNEDRTIQRSLSFGSPRMSRQVDEPMLRDERFKLTTPEFVYVGQGGTNPAGSSDAPKN